LRFAVAGVRRFRSSLRRRRRHADFTGDAGFAHEILDRTLEVLGRVALVDAGEFPADINFKVERLVICGRRPADRFSLGFCQHFAELALGTLLDDKFKLKSGTAGY